MKKKMNSKAKCKLNKRRAWKNWPRFYLLTQVCKGLRKECRTMWSGNFSVLISIGFINKSIETFLPVPRLHTPASLHRL